MRKSDCYIIKDLSMGYIEDTINANTKKFVEKHLENCKDCKEYYNLMKKNIIEDTDIDNKQKDEFELNYLKKIRNNMNILKTIIALIFICCILLISFFTIKYYRITNIINQAYKKIEIMKTLDNYKLSKRTIYENVLDNTQSFDVTYSYYYKEGKSKIKYGDSATSYLQDDSYNKICVYDDLKQIEYSTQNFIEQKRGDLINIYWVIENFEKRQGIADILGLSIREEKYKDKTCYVIRKKANNAYTDIWIDKENLLFVRMITEEKSKNRTEEIYDFSENVVTDEDIDTSILQTEKYKDYKKLEIKNNTTKEIKLYNELMDKYERN
ncbi:MAG: zf-HC2 domain-containing protein [Clostridia bacterium]